MLTATHTTIASAASGVSAGEDVCGLMSMMSITDELVSVNAGEDRISEQVCRERGKGLKVAELAGPG
jgi:hypothetical protein